MEILLSFEETRVIGSLIEKEQTTPEYYPLTLNSLKNACNQKSNREPVVSFDEGLLEKVIDDLRNKSLVSRVTGSDIRVPKYRQVFTEALDLTPQETAVICVLMLRGPQTPGEIKGRTGRIFLFESLAQLDDVLQDLINRENALIVKLPRQTGTKESRYAHLLSGGPDIENTSSLKASDADTGNERIEKLENEVANLKKELEELRKEFDNFRNQFK